MALGSALGSLPVAHLAPVLSVALVSLALVCRSVIVFSCEVVSLDPAPLSPIHPRLAGYEARAQPLQALCILAETGHLCV